jgi:uncharacterized integral membrane protein (TIGR00697 family)
MSQKSESPYKLLTFFLVLNITFQLISDVTAGKIINVFGYGVSATVIYFPIVFIISDVITEVYGYGVARKVLWYTLFASVLAGTTYWIVVTIPGPSYFENQDAYKTVLGIVPRVLIGGWIAIFAGDISNNYVLAKLKILTKGKWLWTRTIGSTLVGQFVNTLIFYGIALSGIIPLKSMATAIIAGWLIKCIVEAAMTPVTYAVIRRVKKVEGLDYYDKDTNFNPFIFK